MDERPQALSARQLMGALQLRTRQLGALGQTIGGSISFVVYDDETEAWLLDLDTPGGATWISGVDRVAAELARRPVSTAVCAKTEAFRNLLLGTADAPSSDIAVVGDASKLTLLGKLIGQSGGAIEQRVRANKRIAVRSTKSKNKKAGRRS